MKRAFLTGAVLVVITALALTACNKGGSSGGSGGGRRSVTLTEADFKYALTDDGKGVKLLEYLGDKGGNLIIPDTFEGFPVVAIGDIDDLNSVTKLPNGEFKGFGPELTDAKIKELATSWVKTSPTARKDRITSITIPYTVTFIGKNAFLNLPNLTSITLPKSLKVIGSSNVFQGCGITSITIPDGVIIGTSAFYLCKTLTTLTIGENVQIMSAAFAGNSELTTVNIPSSVRYISQSEWVIGGLKTDNDAFKDCPKLNIATQNAIKATGYTGKF